jgi:hypothetical protein
VAPAADAPGADAPGPVGPGPAPGLVAVLPPIGAIGSDDGLDGLGLEGLEVVGLVVDAPVLDHGDDVSSVAGIVVAVVVPDGVSGRLAVSGATAQPLGSLTASGGTVDGASGLTESRIASRRSAIVSGDVTVAAAAGAAVLSSSFFSSAVAGLSSCVVLVAPAARLPSPPATGAAASLSDFAAVAVESESASFWRLKNAVTSPPVGMIVTTSQPEAARSLSFVMSPSTS